MRNRGPTPDGDESENELTISIPTAKPSSSWFPWWRKSKDFSPPLYITLCEDPEKESRKCFSWCHRKACTGINQSAATSPKISNQTAVFRVIGVDISHLSGKWQYIIITTGVMLFLLLYGYLQELVVMNKFKRSLGWFVTLLQLTGYAIFAAIQGHIVHGSQAERRIPARYYIILSLLQVFMQGLTNISMHYLNYPAKTLFKSSRVIITMLFGIIFLKKRYHSQDYIIALCMVIGLTTFVAADAHSSPEFDPHGVFLIIIALTADAAILNLQEHCMHAFNAGHDELVYYSNVGAAIVAFCLSLFTGELFKGLAFLHVIGSFSVFVLFLVFACAGFFGVSCLAALTKRFGALTSAITSVVRKGLTLMLSYVIFPEGKALTVWHLFGAGIFMSSLFLKSIAHKKGKEGVTGKISRSDRVSVSEKAMSSSPRRKKVDIEEAWAQTRSPPEDDLDPHITVTETESLLPITTETSSIKHSLSDSNFSIIELTTKHVNGSSTVASFSNVSTSSTTESSTPLLWSPV